MPLGRDAGQMALLLFDGTKRCRTFASKIFRERKRSSPPRGRFSVLFDIL